MSTQITPPHKNNSELIKVHYPEIDVIKGIAILLIILGHAFCEYPIDIESKLNGLIPYINTSSLAIFFVASGFLFSNNLSWLDFFKKKIFRLMIPYIVFCLFTIILRMAFAPFTHSGAPSYSEAFYRVITGGYYWFLYALFLIMIICRLIKSPYILLVIGLSLEVLNLMDIQMPIPIIERVSRFFLYFVFGMMLKSRYKKCMEACRRVQIYLICFVSLIYFILASINDAYLNTINTLIGCVLVWVSSLYLTELGVVSKFLSYFGRNSLQYYLNHLLILLLCYYAAAKLPLQEPFLLWLFIAFLATAISWLMLQVERRWSWSKVLCGLK